MGPPETEGAEMAGMREVCSKCGKNCLGFWSLPDGSFLCGGQGTTGCGPNTPEATYTNESDRKNISLAGRDRSLRNFGSRKVSRDEVSKVSKGKVTVRKMTAAERKRFGLKSA
jgi:hypothetical protein